MFSICSCFDIVSAFSRSNPASIKPLTNPSRLIVGNFIKFLSFSVVLMLSLGLTANIYVWLLMVIGVDNSIISVIIIRL